MSGWGICRVRENICATRNRTMKKAYSNSMIMLILQESKFGAYFHFVLEAITIGWIKWILRHTISCLLRRITTTSFAKESGNLRFHSWGKNMSDISLKDRVVHGYSRFLTLGDRPSDSHEEKIQHHFLINVALLMSMGGIFWGSITAYYGMWFRASIPLGYTFLTALNLIYFHFSKKI